MKLNHIEGNTYYIDKYTNVGVYLLDDERCLIVDVGYEQDVEDLLACLSDNGLSVVALINTHAHVDHAGGDRAIKERTGANIYAPAKESDIIEKPELEMMGLTGVVSMGVLNDIFLKGRHCRPDGILEVGEFKPAYSFHIDSVGDVQACTVEATDLKQNEGKYTQGKALQIVSLAGHSIAQIGVATPDGVIFTGDALFTHGFIEKYKLPYISDVALTLDTLRRMKAMDYKYYVPSHGEVLTDIKGTVEENISLIESVIDYVLITLKRPMTREELCSAIMEHYGVWMSIPQHYLMISYTSAFIRYLYETGAIEPKQEGYRLKWGNIDQKQ